MIVFYAQRNHFHQAFGIDDLTIAIQVRHTDIRFKLLGFGD
ncbi:Uncharacterised protein [Vibrio cholerae]|nr:Uncharacterised protein [Vibrio cholerae]